MSTIKKPSEYTVKEKFEGLAGLVYLAAVPFHYFQDRKRIQEDLSLVQNGWAQLTGNDKLYELTQSNLKK